MARNMQMELNLTQDEKVLVNKLNLDVDGILDMRLAIEAYEADREDFLCVDAIS